MGHGQSALYKWMETVSAGEIHQQLTSSFIRGNGDWHITCNSQYHLTAANLARLRVTFDTYCTPKKVWNKASFCYFIYPIFSPTNISIVTAGVLLWKIASFHAAYPFHLDTSQDLNFEDFLRAVVLLSQSKRKLYYLDGYYMAFRPRPSYRRALIVHQGRGEIDRRRWLFLSLAERKSGGYIFSSEKESLLASPGHKELAAIYPVNDFALLGCDYRNQDCDPRSIDVLDVLCGIQPRKNFCQIVPQYPPNVDPVSRRTLRATAERMPKGILPEEEHLPHNQLKELVQFLSFFKIGAEGGLLVSSENRKQCTETLLEQIKTLGKSHIEWEVFNDFMVKEESFFEPLWKLFDIPLF